MVGLTGVALSTVWNCMVYTVKWAGVTKTISAIAIWLLRLATETDMYAVSGCISIEHKLIYVSLFILVY